jgi:Family of unknown function (DUF6882)
MSAPSDFSPIFQAFAADCTAAAIQQQDLINEFLGTHHRNLDLSARTLTGNGLVLSGVTGLGSFSHLSQTWLWMWENPAFDWEHPAVSPVRTIYQFGERQGIPELTTGHLDLSGFANPHGAATTLAIASAYVLGGQGIWSCRINDGKGSTYVHIDDPQVPVAWFDPATAPDLLMRAAQVWPSEQRAVVRGMFRHFNIASRETPERIAGRHPGGAVLIADFDPAGNITAVSGDSASRPR